MSGSQFELYVADLLRAMGHNTRVLGGSGDQGVDLIVDYFGERLAVQCKNYAKPVGNKPVQEVFAGAKHHGCQQAWVVAPAGFTNGAYELARSVGVQLFAAGAIRAWVGEVDKVASPHPRSESFPPTYPTSELRKQDSESYHTLLDDYEMELTRLERVRADLTTNPSMDEDRSSRANVLKILFDTEARIHDIRRQLDAFEKLDTESLEQKQRHAQLKARHEQMLGTGPLEQKQRHAQLKARYEQIQEKDDQEARKRHGGGQMSRRRRRWRASEGRPWRASEDPLWVWGCAGPSLGCLVILFVCSIAVLNELFFGGSFGEGLVYGLVVIGGAVGLVYAAARYYS